MKNYYIEKENLAIRERSIDFFIQEKHGAGDTALAHLHPALEIIYINDGIFSVFADGRYEKACPGDLVIIRANTVHAIKLTEGGYGNYCVLKVPPTMILNIFTGKSLLRYGIPFLKKDISAKFLYNAALLPARISEIIAVMINELNSTDETLYISERIHASELLLEIVRNLPDFMTAEDTDTDINQSTLTSIFEILSYINENYSDGLSAQFCAGYIHVSYSYFAKLFRTVTGKTFKQYVSSVRLAQAQKLLYETGLPITDISLACGYNSLSYFIAEYKRAFGLSPNSDRKQMNVRTV